MEDWLAELADRSMAKVLRQGGNDWSLIRSDVWEIHDRISLNDLRSRPTIQIFWSYKCLQGTGRLAVVFSDFCFLVCGVSGVGFFRVLEEIWLQMLCLCGIKRSSNYIWCSMFIIRTTI